MEWVRTVMLNVIILVFFATVLDLLLPNDRFRNYIKMAMGFFAVLTLLQPIAEVLQQEYWQEMSQKAIQAGQMAVAESKKDDMQMVYTDYAEQYTAQAELQYAAQTARQVEALLLFGDYDVQEVDCCFVSTAADDNQRQMQVQICLQGNENEASSKIQKAISGYFGLDATQVQVQWVQEGDRSDARVTEQRTE